MARQKGTMAGAGFARKLRRAIDLKWSEWLELAIAAEALLEARIVFARLPARSLLVRLRGQVSVEPRNCGKQDVEICAPDQDVDARLLRLGWAISAAAAMLPWRTDCLIRCLAAAKILRRRGLTPDFYLGVTRHLDSNFGAHGWVRCHGISVAGGKGSEFEVLIGPGAFDGD